MLNLDTLLNIFTYIPKVKKLRLVCKLWYELLPYKIIKFYKLIDDIEIKYFVNGQCIHINIFNKLITLTGSFLEIFDELVNTRFTKIEYETDCVPKFIDTQIINQCSTMKKLIFSNRIYKILIRTSENIVYQYQIFIPLIIHDKIIYDFKFFTLECRDLLPNEFKPISIIIKTISSIKNYDINFYNITRDLPVSVFSSIMFNYLPKIKDTEYLKYYQEMMKIIKTCINNTGTCICKSCYSFVSLLDNPRE